MANVSMLLLLLLLRRCCCCRLGRRCPATQLSHKTNNHPVSEPLSHPLPAQKLGCHHNLQQQKSSEGVIRGRLSLSNPLYGNSFLSFFGSESFCFCGSEWAKLFFFLLFFFSFLGAAASSCFLSRHFCCFFWVLATFPAAQRHPPTSQPTAQPTPSWRPFVLRHRLAIRDIREYIYSIQSGEVVPVPHPLPIVLALFHLSSRLKGGSWHLILLAPGPPCAGFHSLYWFSSWLEFHNVQAWSGDLFCALISYNIKTHLLWL